MSSGATIKLNNAKIFQRENLILQDVNIELEKGEFVYLIGKTGSGKSSLLKTLYGELKLEHGTGQVAEYDLIKLKRKQIPHLRRKIGIVFQDFQLLMDRSVGKNLSFVMRATGWRDKKKITARAEEVLERVGLETKLYKMPHQLSGGEQQRVAIARALLNDPEIILADEPTGNLDPETTGEIMSLLFEISKSGRTILMATHDYTIIEKFPSRALRTENQTVLNLSHASAFNPGNPIANEEDA
jgi:cell division transport system ATP-binding protein